MKVLVTPFIGLISLFASVLGQPVSSPNGVSCSGLDISSANINAALEQALGHLSAKTLIGHNGYPHLFDNPGHLTFQSDCHGPYYGFPLVKDGLYTGGDPGSDRIIIGNWDGTNARFCDAITHRGADEDTFLLCDNTEVVEIVEMGY